MTNAASIASHGRTGKVGGASIASLGRIMPAIVAAIGGFIKITLIRISEYLSPEITIEDSV